MTTDDARVDRGYRERVALARSILGHTRTDDQAVRAAIDKALRALDGAGIDELREVSR